MYDVRQIPQQAARQLYDAGRRGDALDAQQRIKANPVAGAGALAAACRDNALLCAQTLLQQGADIHLKVAAAGGARSALDVATGAGNAPPSSAAALVILEGHGWTMVKRQHMTAAVRDRAEALAWIGSKSTLPNDAWNALIIPRVLCAAAESGFVRFAYRP